MPKKLLKRFLPDHRKIREHQHLKRFGALLQDPNLWHLSRRSVPGAFSIGLFVAFIPVPFQMVIAAALAIVARVNLPISVTLVWVTNPLTMPALFYSAYRVGAWILNEPTRGFRIELSWTWLYSELSAIWAPFLLGCLICGTLGALIGNLVVRSLWRLHLVKYWQARKLRLGRRRRDR